MRKVRRKLYFFNLMRHGCGALKKESRRLYVCELSFYSATAFFAQEERGFRYP
jgi:hypothetical protein